MRVLMKKTVDGSRTGAKTERFLAGESYDFINAGGEGALLAVFLREGWAVETEAAPPPVAAPPADVRPPYRLPLLEEYVAKGYLSENYEDFIKAESAEAEKRGFRVEVRSLNEAELAAEENERKEFEQREKQIEKEKADRESAARPAPPPPSEVIVPPPPPSAPPPPAAAPAKRKHRG